MLQLLYLCSKQSELGLFGPAIMHLKSPVEPTKILQQANIHFKPGIVSKKDVAFYKTQVL